MSAIIIITFLIVWLMPLVTVGFTYDELNLFGKIWAGLPLHIIALVYLTSLTMRLVKKLRSR